MKHLLFILFLASVTLTCFASTDFSLSGNGSSMNGNMKREGNLIYMNYSMNGLNSPAILNQVPDEQKAAVAGINSADIDMIMNCSNNTFKINSFKMTDASGYSMESTLNADWMPLTKQEDIQKLKELCGKL